MALCEHCRAELAGQAEQLPPPWFDHDRHTVAGEHIMPKFWQVLEILWRRRNKVVSTDTLMTLLYSDQPDHPPHYKIIDVFIGKLRRALEPTPYSIRNDWGSGFQLLDHKQGVDPVVLGEVDDGVPQPQRQADRYRRWMRNDKYELAELKVGQSRRVDNAKLATLKTACLGAKKRGYGRFAAGFDEAGHMRIWRVE